MRLRSDFLMCVGLLFAVSAPAGENVFRAGAATVDISPTKFPVRVNGGFTEREAGKLLDSLQAKALVLDDGQAKIVIVLVDSCMLPRTLIDEAKELASKTTLIPTDHMLVAATHTHSAPSAMGCLGSRADDFYAQLLPGKIAQVIENAVAALQPAKVGWGGVQAPELTYCRRWIRRFDKLLTDPFGDKNVKANMHPGHMSPDALGPSGPADSELGVLSVQTAAGKPLALLANYSMHYFGTGMLSSDYFGSYAVEMAKRLAPQADASPPVVMMTQGTSGDLYRADYSKPAKGMSVEQYAAAMADKTQSALEKMQHRDWVPLKIRETKVTLGFRLADEKRLAWAKSVVSGLKDRLPRSQPEIYAHEVLFLAARPTAELKLQALRIGEMAFTALPNEVFSITGLKLKAQSPLTPTFNIELANGAEGYIPPPEQHSLGGYTTWPARTAGLEVQAEPRIVEELLKLLEEVSGKPRRKPADATGAYGESVLKAQPLAYWRLNEFNGPQATDASPHARHARYEDKIAFYLTGPEAAGFSGETHTNRAPHFAGGRLRATPGKLDGKYTVSFWLWNALPKEARAVTGYAFSYGADNAAEAPGDHVGIGGSALAPGKLLFFNGNAHNQVLEGKTEIPLKTWAHVALVREGGKVTVYLNGKAEISGDAASSVPAEGAELFFGARNDNFAAWEGKLDEIALFDRALSAEEIATQFAAAGMPGFAATPEPAPKAPPQNLKAPSPQEALAALRVKEGFEIQLVAAEPLTSDPVAFDWGPDGKLWVAEMADYPLGMDGKMKPGGRIRVLEDTNGDGVYDKSTLFLDNVRMPTGVLAWRGGVLISAAPEILFASDTDGDGKADERKVLYSGFKEGNPQLRINALRWGLDGWVYCANGWSGGKIKSEATGESVDISGRDLRIRPDDGRMEAVSGVSQFGRERDDFDHWFGVNNSHPLWHYVLSEQYARRNPHVPALDPVRHLMLPRNPKIFPLCPPEKRFHSFNEAGRFTSACSVMIYRDEQLFPAGEMHAFMCEPFHNLVHHEELRDEGISFSAKRADDEQESEFLASPSRWFRPVMVRMGPDGALYVADMCRLMIEHPDWLPAEGKTELAPIYRAGEETGRLFRILKKGAPRRAIPNFASLTTEQLIEKLNSANGFERDLAQRMLVWRGDKTLETALGQLVRQAPRPATRAQAMWTLECLGSPDPLVIAKALSDPSPRVREQAARIAENKGECLEVMNAAIKLSSDDDPKVRLQVACLLGYYTEPQSGKALAQIAIRDAGDKYVVAAVLSSAVPHCATLAAEFATAPANVAQAYFEPLLNVAIAKEKYDALTILLRSALATDDRLSKITSLTVLLESLRKRNTPLAKLRAGNRGALQAELERIDAIRQDARALCAAADAEFPLRTAAIRLLGFEEEERGSAAELLKPLLAPQIASELQLAAVKSLSRLGGAGVPENLLGGWKTSGPALRTAIADELLSRDEWCLALLAGIEAKKVSALDIDAQRRERLLKHKTTSIKEQAKKLFAATVNEDRQKVVDAFTPALKLTPQRDNGVKIFARACVACHKLDGVGQEIGPDLKSVAGHPPEKLLASILDPSRGIEPGYMAFACVLNSGEQVYGLITAESGASIAMKLADNSTRSILRTEIKVLRGTNVSLMPEGLEAGLSQQDIADLIHYLRTPTVAAGK